MRVYDYNKFKDFTELYQDILLDLLYDPEYKIAPRGLPVREMVNVAVIMDPSNVDIDFTKTKAPERQPVYDKYRKEELAWYLSGNTLASTAPSKFWERLADEEGHITSNYGHMMLFDPIYPEDKDTSCCSHETAFDRVVKTLIKDPDSRQAIMHYNQPRHCYPQNKDFPCTVFSQVFIRDGKLHMTTHMRSCDIFLGFTYDSCWSAHLMGMILDELHKRGISLDLGDLTMTFGSLHMYEKNADIIGKIALNQGDET